MVDRINRLHRTYGIDNKTRIYCIELGRDDSHMTYGINNSYIEQRNNVDNSRIEWSHADLHDNLHM